MRMACSALVLAAYNLSMLVTLVHNLQREISMYLTASAPSW
jgi:hypothetical protein